MEAAKKATERKASQTSKLKASLNEETSKASEAPVVSSESDTTKSVEDSGAVTETAAKAPEKLAEEGVTSAKEVVEADLDVADVKADTIEENQPKVKSPLAEEATFAPSVSPEKAEDGSVETTHQGSSVSGASKEKIQEVEDKNAISEEPEEPEGAKASVEASGDPVSKAAADNDAIEKSTTVDVTVSSPDAKVPSADVTVSTAGEAPSGEKVDAQKQDPKDADAAGKSVGD